MKRARVVRKVSVSAIAKQWDSIATSRDHQIRSGKDVSYSQILAPRVLSLVGAAPHNHIVDVGCGTGVLTERLTSLARSVVGIDVSRRSIEIASTSGTNNPRSAYYRTSVEAFATNHHDKFDAVVANMFLQDAPNLEQTVQALSKLSRHGGVLVVTLTHPWFWPVYWGYSKERWFRYDCEIAIAAPFRISAVSRPLGVTTHFHRPLSMYLGSLRKAGLNVDFIEEPMPSKKTAAQYRREWKFPRFLILRCSKLYRRLK